MNKHLLSLSIILLFALPGVLSAQHSDFQKAGNWMAETTTPHGSHDKSGKEMHESLLEEILPFNSYFSLILSVEQRFSINGKDRDYFFQYIKKDIFELRKIAISSSKDGKKVNKQTLLDKFENDIEKKAGEFNADKTTIIDRLENPIKYSGYNFKQENPGNGVLTAGQPCTNEGFENGNLGAWQGSWGIETCESTFLGICTSYGGANDPYYTNGFNTGATNSTTGQHVLCTAGTDPNVPIQRVRPGGGTFSARVGDPATGDYGASRLFQTFMVNAANSNFTYWYAVVLQDGGHTAAEQPYFRIRMYDQGGAVISCASFDVNGSTAGSIGGFVTLGDVRYKDWSPVVIPLNNYIGQNVTIEFITADCTQGGHYGYAYVDADCQPLEILASSPAVCGGSSITLSAPAGAATYNWSGPGIVSGGNTATVTINAGGTYTVDMTSQGSGCPFSLDTIIPQNPNNPVANFTANTVCTGQTTTFTDQSTPVGMITQWQWDFNNDGIIDNTSQNPTYTFPAAGTYPVTLTVTWPPCVATTTINVTVNAIASATITPAGPFCINAPAINLVANPAAGTWSGTGVNAAGLFTPSSAGSGTHTITFTPGGTCATVNTTNITVNSLPVATVSANKPCIGQPLSLLGGPAGLPATGYDWTGPVNYTDTQNPNEPTAATTDAGTYTLTITDANGCQDTAMIIVSTNALPVPVAGSNTPVCVGQALNLTGSGGTPTWWGPDGFNNSTPNPSISPVALAADGVYHLTVTDANGCVDSITTTVVINPLPAPTASSNSPVCFGQTLNLTGSGGTPSWWGPNGFNNSTPNPSISPVTMAADGVYHLSVTDANGCVDSITTTVVINPLPTPIASSNTPVCIGQTLNLTGSGGTPSWWGPNGFNNSTPNPVISPVSLAADGVYHLSVTDANGCVDSITTTVVINPLPMPAASSNSPVCFGQTLNLTASGGATATWWGPAGFGSMNLTDSINNVTLTASGTYHVTVSNGNGCVDSTTTTVVINSLPTPSASSNSPVCFGQTLNLTGSGGTPTWWGPDGFNNSTPNPSISPVALAADGVYHLTVTDANGCVDSITTTVVINPLPAPTASSNTPVCFGQTLNLTGSGGTPTWWGPNGFNNSTLNPSISPVTMAADGVYHLSVTDANGCVDSITTTVVINPLPTPIASSNSPVCFGQTLNLSASGGNSATWWGPNGFTSANLTDSIINVPHTAGGIYHVSVSNGNGCIDSTTVTVVIDSLPIPTALNNGPKCEGQQVCFTGGGGVSYIWSGPNNYSSNIANPCFITPALTDTGDYKIIVTNANGCVDSTITHLSMYHLPDASLNNTTVCTYDTVHFTDLSTVQDPTVNPITSWFWSFGTGQGNSSQQDPTCLYNSCGQYQVTLVVSTQKGCVDIANQNITVKCVPNAFTGSVTTTNICQNLNATFDNNISSPDNGAMNFTWDFDASSATSPNSIDSLSSNATPDAYHHYAVAGNYNIVVVAEENGCFDTTSTTITIHPMPTADFSVSSVCLNASSIFTDASAVASPDNISTYEWDFENDGSIDETNSTAGTTHIYPSTSVSNATLTVTTNNGCADVITQPVTVYELPVASYTYTDVCDGNNVLLNSTSTIPAGTISQFLWDYNFPSSNTSGSASESQAFAVGPHIIQLTVVSDNGCRDSITHTATVHPLPTVNFVSDYQNGCQPLCVQFTDLSSIINGDSNVSFNWTLGEGSTSSNQNPTLCYDDAGKYTVGLTVTSNFGCVNSLTLSDYITVYPNPIAAFTANPLSTTIIDPNITCVDLSNGNGDQISDVIWNFGDATPNSILDAQENIVHTYTDTGYFEITQTVITNHGCTDSTEIKIHIGPDWAFFIPNAFTPTGDGTNDQYNGKGFGILEYELLIFNRWGESIARITDINSKGWDGKDQNGDLCKQDVYIYEVRFKDIVKKQPHKYVGTVTLLK